ncbi:MAG TPA: hypothetical protein VF710_03650 [Longimicrobium sp.]
MEGIEPQQKRRMRLAEQVELQRQVRAGMRRFDRAAFRGPIVLQLTLGTTAKNPPHAHSITKNLLDLLGKPLSGLGSRHALLYHDDRQVHGLAVRCRHRQPEPRIGITATPVACFLSDLDLAFWADRDVPPQRESDPFALEDSLDSLRDLLQNEAAYRAHPGDEWYEAMRDFTRFDVQRMLLTDSVITVSDLAALYLRTPERHPAVARLWEELQAKRRSVFRRSLLRIHLHELPQQAGAGDAYVRHVEAQINSFRDRFGWALQPLRLPVALQVIVKPAPEGSHAGLNDLDNVARNYIIPRVVEAFAPPSNIAWTVDVERLRGRDPAAAAEWEQRQSELPKTAQQGLTRFEVWRIPPDTDPGFVSAALVADVGDFSGPFIRLDRAVESLRELDDAREDPW